MSKIVKKLAMLMAGVLLTLAACGGGNSGGNKTLTIAVDRASNSINNVLTSEQANSDVIGNFLEGLLIRDLTGKLVGGGAESHTISDDGLVYTFKLRENYWSNGDPVTADDFVFSWREQATNAKSNYKQYQEYLKNGKKVVKGELPATELGIEAKDNRTLVITLETPRTYFIELLDHMSLMPINQKFYEEVGAENYGTTKDTILANGAYTLEEYEGSEGWVFKKRADYWDAKNVSIEQVNIRVVKEGTTRASMWDNKELDETYLTSDLVDKYQNDPQFVSELDWGMYYMYVSPSTKTPAPVYENINLRKTILHGIDRELLTDSVLKDGSLPANFIIPNGMSVAGYDGLFRDAPNAYNDRLFNLAEATKYWEAAKKELGSDSITIPLLVDDAEINKKAFSNIKAQLEQNFSGLTVDLKIMPNQMYFPTLYEYSTPAARHGWVTTINDPSTILELFIKDSTSNFGRVSLDEYTALYEKTESAEDMLDIDQRVVDLVAAENELLEQAYNIPLYQRGRKKLVADGVKGLTNDLGRQNPFYRWVTKA